ncbi:O-antigen ligase family protein [uncultured Sphingomonas sp.]|uniref:O-antigen ligase family protein n=1 Tax=uncultured Sphingomonas sp. TaxID=158754 RepID=UPI0025EECF17|nr:O-antigen ligase family protein [uncultured Sphingomonas sp.]
MSSISTADLPRGGTGHSSDRRTAEMVRALAMVPLIVYAVLTQLDAVANRLSGGSPIGTTELTLAALIGATVLIFLLPRDVAPARAYGSTGARLIALMFCWAVVSWTLSAHKAEGLSYLSKLLVAVAPALCTLVIADRPARIRLLLWAIIAAGAVSAAIVVIEARTGTRLVSTSVAATTAGFEGVARSAGGSDQNPTTAAQMLLVSVALAAALLFSGERRFRLIYAGVVALGTLALVLGSARSAIIGLAVAFGLIALSLRRKPYFPLLIVAGLVACVGAIPFLPPTLLERFSAVTDFGRDQTLFRRITYLRIGFDLLQQSPLWGVGPGNFPLYYLLPDYRWMPGRELYPRELHNTYLDAAVEYGLVGFVAFVAALGHALASAWRAAHARNPTLARSAFAVGVALAALMAASFFMPHKNLRYLWLMVAIAVQCGRLRAAEEDT